jgi:hypothetical protein
MPKETIDKKVGEIVYFFAWNNIPPQSHPELRTFRSCFGVVRVEETNPI